MTKRKTASLTVGAQLEDLTSSLKKLSETPQLDAQVLLAYVMEKPRSWLLAHTEAPLNRMHAAALQVDLKRMESGEPLPYVLGSWEFFGLGFELTPDVLIPRPETEILIERAIAWLQTNPTRRRTLDVGTGSGCIAIALAVNVPDLEVTATDISPAALEVAKHNAVKNGVEEQINFLCCDLFPPNEKIDLIAANLPYVPTETLHTLPVYQREPNIALNGGVNGLDTIRRLIVQAPEHLSSGGMILMEIEASQGEKVLSLAYDIFSEAEIHLRQDLAGYDRLLEVHI